MDRWQLRQRQRRTCDLEQVDTAARPYRQISLTLKWMLRQSFQVPRFGQPSMVRPRWNEVLDALQEDVDFCEDGETTIARGGSVTIPVVFYITDDGQEIIEENEVPQILLQARPAFRHPGYRTVGEDLNVVQKSRGLFGHRRGASGRDQGPRMKRSSIQQPHEVCKMSQTWALGSRVSRRESRTTQRRKGSSLWQSPRNEDPSFSALPGHCHSRPWRSPVGHWPRGTRRKKQQL